jgi:sigma-B regulation protein RsbU (phosphoserine phosphatase)
MSTKARKKQSLMMRAGIAFRISALILGSITIIFSVAFIYNYRLSKDIIEAKIESSAENLSLATINRIDAVLSAIERVPRDLALFLEEFSYGGGDLVGLLRAVIERNPDIYGAAIAFEPFAYSSNTRFFAPYYYRKDGRPEFTYIPYDYFGWDWYQTARELEQPVWSEPYYDEGAGGIVMATFSVPFYRRTEGRRILTGIVTADVSLSWLRDIVSSLRISETGYGFLISKNGTFITHPNAGLVMNESIFSVAEMRKDQALRVLGRRMIRGESGFTSFVSLFTGKRCWIRFGPLPSNGWSLGVLFPQDELMADVKRLNRAVVFIGIAGLCLVFLVIIFISGSISRPLKGLAQAAERISKGDLDAGLPIIKTRDEVAQLGDSFASMQASLKRYIAELKETTAAKERIESELKIAREIQMSILPKTFPPFPERDEFELYATIEPAREVGGDLYDFFFLDKTHLCFLIGDVSGKGVPASLFMAIARTLIKTKAAQGLEPARLLTRVNQDLCIDNEAMMFVTLFLGVLDLGTGGLEYCNAGHNAPYLLKASGEMEALRGRGGTALGVMEEAQYLSHRLFLTKGDALFLFTDGVTEAQDASLELFSERRLLDVLCSSLKKPVKEMVLDVMNELRAFSGKTEQTDDITMLVIRYIG